MEFKVTVPNYSEIMGIKYNWEEGFAISVESTNSGVKILANKEGLKSLANHFLNLAQEEVPKGYHLHFDEHNSLEAASLELIIEKS